MAEIPCELGDFNKVWVNSGIINPLRNPTSVSTVTDRSASYGNQIISSTRPSCWIQISTVMCEQHCGRPSDVYSSTRRMKLTALETISRWLLLKNEKIALWAYLSGLRRNVRTPSIARWNARGRLYIRRNWTVFAISCGWDVMSGNPSKSAFSKGVGHFERRFKREGSVDHQPVLVSEN